jgi:hypothetical protein
MQLLSDLRMTTAMEVRHLTLLYIQHLPYELRTIVTNTMNCKNTTRAMDRRCVTKFYTCGYSIVS